MKRKPIAYEMEDGTVLCADCAGQLGYFTGHVTTLYACNAECALCSAPLEGREDEGDDLAVGVV